MKLDITKVFDTVRSSFIVDSLATMNIPEQFIQWIHIFLSTAAFSVAVNGELEGFLGSERGLRKGCSLSQYLFVIAVNLLSRLLNLSAVSVQIGYHPACKKS